MLAEFWPRHIPGEPSIVINGRPGAGGVTAANYVYNVAAKDGTQLGLTLNLVPLFQVAGGPGVKYDIGRLQWIGNMWDAVGILAVSDRAPATSIEAAKSTEVALGCDFELAANALGVCDAAVEMAMQHARTWRQAGKYLNEHQVIQLKLSEMHMLTEALRSFVMRTAWEMERAARGDKTVRGSANTQFLMNFSSDVIQRVTHLNMDVHGTAGAIKEVGVEKLVRDGIIWTHLAGASVQRMKSIRQLVK